VEKGEKKKKSPVTKTTKGFKVKEIGSKKQEDQVEEIEEKKITGLSIQRYKGLGEMNPDELFKTTMDPENRILKQIEIVDAAKTDEIFEVLMGKEVSPRKRFIQTRAQGVENLDI